MDSPSDGIAHSNSEKQMDWLWMEIRKMRLDEHFSPEYSILSHTHTQHWTGETSTLVYQISTLQQMQEVVESIIRETSWV